MTGIFRQLLTAILSLLLDGWQPVTAGHGSGAAFFTVFVKGAGFDFAG